MARVTNRLKAQSLAGLPAGKHADGAGLWLYKSDKDLGKWVLRYTLYGRRHEMGLGALASVSLKEARQSAEAWRAVVRQGKSPIRERERAREQAIRNANVLADVAQDAFESRKAELKGDGSAGRWFSPLELHVLPKLGKTPISEIDQRDIRDTLSPIWHTKSDTARKALNRLSICFQHAAALGLDVDLQATAKARALLGKQRHTTKNIPSMDWREVPAFYQSLNGGSLAELALRFLILTGMRSAPIRHVHEGQISDGVWTIPGDLMKGRRDATSDFLVPLSSEAAAVLDEARPFARNGFFFPNRREGVISDMTMSALMKRRGLEARPHGFRSSFRNWLAEETDASFELAETCIAHVVGSKTIRAYRQAANDQRRRALMELWGRFVSTGVSRGDL